MLVGRGPECSFHFDEPIVSARHASIETAPDGFYLIDQGSFNGTYVNGQRISQVKLNSGDLIEFGSGGPQMLAIIDEEAAAQTEAFGGARETVPLQQTVRNIGLYNPERDSGRMSSFGVGCVLSLAAIFALMVAGILILDLGPFVAIVSGIVALLPAIIYLQMLLWLDRYDPEPFRPLAFALAFGALVAVFFSTVFNSVFGVFAGDTLTAIVSAPLVEEATKGLGVLAIVLLFRREFDSVVDGIVYAGVVALGFATIENILYYGRALSSGGLGEMFATFVLRGIFSPFSHVLFSSMTGIGFGIMRETHNRRLKIFAPLAGYLSAVFLHALWNGAATYAGRMFFAFYLLIEAPLFIGFLVAIAILVRRERKILQHALSGEVARGLITPEQLAIVTSIPRRSWWLIDAIGKGTRWQARRRFLRAVAKLGLCHWHVARATAAGNQTQSFSLIARLQAEVLALRSEVG
jgi:RsiW-degrading membrane proteinase PrsW (M82 family)